MSQHDPTPIPEQPTAPRTAADRLRAYLSPSHQANELLDEALAEAAASVPAPEQEEAVRERLAAIEHDQWIEWSRTIAAEGLTPERIERWQRYWVPYADLDEPTKDHDRKWADKVLAALGEIARDTRYNAAIKEWMRPLATPPPVPAAPCTDELCVMQRGHDGKHETSVERVRNTPEAARLAEAVRAACSGCECHGGTEVASCVHCAALATPPPVPAAPTEHWQCVLPIPHEGECRRAVPAAPSMDWATLSNIIREVDGNHDLGAGELAQRIIEHPRWAVPAAPPAVTALLQFLHERGAVTSGMGQQSREEFYRLLAAADGAVPAAPPEAVVHVADSASTIRCKCGIFHDVAFYQRAALTGAVPAAPGLDVEEVARAAHGARAQRAEALEEALLRLRRTDLYDIVSGQATKVPCWCQVAPNSIFKDHGEACRMARAALSAAAESEEG